MKQSSQFIRDNSVKYGTVVDYLKQEITSGSQLSLVSAYFTIYGFQTIQKELESCQSVKFLFGEPRFLKSKYIDPLLDNAPMELTEQGISLRDSLTRTKIAKACANWIKSPSVEIQTLATGQLLHGKMIYIEHQDQSTALIQGSSNLTAQGLGVHHVNQNKELNLIIEDDNLKVAIKEWFDHIWNDTGYTKNIKNELLQQLNQLYAYQSPELIYFKTLYEIMKQDLADHQYDLLLQEKTLNQYQIGQTLFQFQKDAVSSIIDKLTKYQGCILADSVGLGKTYTALAVIKYFERLNQRVLVIVPRKLINNWEIYLSESSKLNPLKQDHFRYTLIAHTDLTREKGKTSRGDDLSQIEWDQFDLVVIDESHHFRNGLKSNKLKNNENYKNRYQILLERVLKSSGKNTKVLLLSATPLNNGFDDLKHQIALMTKGNSKYYEDILGIKDVDVLMNQLRNEFKKWCAKKKSNNIQEFIQDIPADFFTLLDALSLSRSRSMIAKHYGDEIDSNSGKTMSEIIKNNYLPSEHIACDIDTQNQFDTYGKIAKLFNPKTDADKKNAYQFSLFRSSKYILKDYIEQYKKINLYKQNESSFIGMVTVGYLKRLESSISAFRLSLETTLNQINELIIDLIKHQHDHNHKLIDNYDEFQDISFDDQDDDNNQLDKNAEELSKNYYKKYNVNHLDINQWLTDLKKDQEILQHLLRNAKLITLDRDLKLFQLKQKIIDKLKNPTLRKDDSPNYKVLIFTAFTDTAHYLYEALKSDITSLNHHVGLITGTLLKTTYEHSEHEFNEILTHFSPISKNRKEFYDYQSQKLNSEIDVLIATDCISEGQNLQDCDLVIHYDIHWNPVRLIQRFGRIDRIHSPNKALQAIYFWPTKELNDYLNLEARVKAKMALVSLSSTGESDMFSEENISEINEDLNFRNHQLQKMRNNEFNYLEDTEEFSFEEFSLESFRLDLNQYIKANEKKLHQLPVGLHTVVPSTDDLSEGVIFCLRDTLKYDDNSDIYKEQQRLNGIYPYYLCYLSKKGTIIYRYTQIKSCLTALRLLCLGKNSPFEKLCQDVDMELFGEDFHENQDVIFQSRQHQFGLDQQHMTLPHGLDIYTHLVMQMIHHIQATGTKQNLEASKVRRNSAVVSSKIVNKSLNQFELISWFIIKSTTG